MKGMYRCSVEQNLSFFYISVVSMTGAIIVWNSFSFQVLLSLILLEYLNESACSVSIM